MHACVTRKATDGRATRELPRILFGKCARAGRGSGYGARLLGLRSRNGVYCACLRNMERQLMAGQPSSCPGFFSGKCVEESCAPACDGSCPA